MVVIYLIVTLVLLCSGLAIWLDQDKKGDSS